jgi:hypothetical protein
MRNGGGKLETISPKLYHAVERDGRVSVILTLET